MSKQKIGRDNWLYILTNAITNYVEEGGEAQVASDPAAGAITVRLCQVRPGDRRLHPEFVALLAPVETPAAPAGQEGEPRPEPLR
jgi:hypothetical protein